MDDPRAPWHAHIYFQAGRRGDAEALRERFLALQASGEPPEILFVGELRDGKVGPHPVPQYEVHFRGAAVPAVRALVVASGLRALLHPLTDDDLADHTTLADWIGEPIELDLTTLDPPGVNQGVARFGKTDF
jgi:DOPA 4,5-dioxygenase